MRSTGSGFTLYADNDQRALGLVLFSSGLTLCVIQRTLATALIVPEMQASALFLLSLRFCVGLWTCRERPNPLVRPRVLDVAHIGVGEEPGPP